jgi:hypothetical protein
MTHGSDDSSFPTWSAVAPALVAVRTQEGAGSGQTSNEVKKTPDILIFDSGVGIRLD